MSPRDNPRDFARWQRMQQDRFMCMSTDSDADRAFSYTPPFVSCDGCGAPVREHAKCEYCGRK